MSDSRRSAPLDPWALLGLLRWPGAISAAANAGAAFILAHEPDSPGGLGAALGAGAGGALVYLGGVALNDVADARVDAELHPHRPIPAGQVSVGAAAGFGFLLLLAGLTVSLSLAGLHAGFFTACAAVFALAYDVGAKKSGLLGGLCMGLARGTNAMAGAVAAWGWSGPLFVESVSPAHLFPAFLALYTLLLTLVSTLEERAPTRVRVIGAGAALSVLVLAPWPLFTAQWWWAPALALLPLVASFVNGVGEALRPDGPGVGAIVRRAVFGFPLLDAAWLLGIGKYDYGFWWILGYVSLRVLLARLRS